MSSGIAGMRPRRLGRDGRRAAELSPTLIALAGVLGALLFGYLLGDGKEEYGVALVFAAAYIPLVFLDLATAIAVWVAILFFTDLTALQKGPHLVGVLMALGWLGTFLNRRGSLRLLAHHRRVLLSVAVLCSWVSLTIAWAAFPGKAATEAAYWWFAALALLIVMTSVKAPREAALIALAFVIGAGISVLIGVASGGLSTAATSEAAVSGRLVGGAGDPNEAAAGYVAAMYLTLGLFSVYKRSTSRLALGALFVLLTVGMLATKSRGGLVALAVAAIAALILAPGQRKRLLGVLGCGAIAVAIFSAANPGTLSRITDIGGGSDGRSDLWAVALEIFRRHPWVGIGGGNFIVVEPQYALQSGPLQSTGLIVAQPHLVHNTYLQLLVEEGIPGLLLYLLVLVVCLAAAYRAARVFERLGQRANADLTRAVMMGTIAMLAANFFITDGDDWRLWVLLGLGPAMLTIANRATRGAEPGAVHPTSRPPRGRQTPRPLLRS
jgi:O-antigen ligase